MKITKQKIVTALSIVAIAVAFFVLDAWSRPVPAFGGGDMVGLLLIGWAVYTLFEKEERDNV